ncbi:MAG: hypothetical protein V1837_05830 [Candidatus Woesearchaeota archaeon]
MSPEDIPKYVRYDFFIAILGIFIVYFAFSNANAYGNTTIRWSLFVFGVIISVYGLAEMSSSYYAEKKIQKIKNVIEWVKVKKDFDKIPKNQNEKEDIPLLQFLRKHSISLIISLIIIVLVILFYLRWL